MNEQIMTRIEFAIYLKVSPQTVDRAIKEGMPAMKLGGAVRIPLNEAVVWMNERIRKGVKS